MSAVVAGWQYRGGNTRGDAVVQGGSGATYVGSPGGQALQLDDEYLQLRFSGGLGDVAEGF